MTDYPAEGSILVDENIIVVRFSEDPYWASENMTGWIRDAEGCKEVTVSPRIVNIHTARVKDDQVTLDGIAFLRGEDGSLATNTVYLKDIHGDSFYEVNTARTQEKQTTERYITDGVSYDPCGFRAVLPLSFLREHSDRIYQVYVRTEIETGIEWKATDALFSYTMLMKQPPAPASAATAAAVEGS